MTYEKAAQALAAAGLLDKDSVASAASVLASPSIDITCPAWAEALAGAGSIGKADVEAAADAMEKAGIAEAEDDPQAFEDGLENAGIL
ncbi:hypothetical protein ACFLV7_14670 [Chloroflexota bacterium]